MERMVPWGFICSLWHVQPRTFPVGTGPFSLELLSELGFGDLSWHLGDPNLGRMSFGGESFHV